VTLPRAPIWMLSLVVAPKAIRKNSSAPTQNTGLRSW
jgi:hypothetical protein